MTALFIGGCRGGLPPSPELLETVGPAEAFATGDGACELTAQRKPDLMAWSSSSRANLKVLHEQGVVAVRYVADDCALKLQVLDCVGDEAYRFSPYSARESKVAQTQRELMAKLPLGGAELGGEVGDGRALRTDYLLVGVKQIPVRASFPLERLRGKCDDATHVVSKLFIGGFGMIAGRSDVVAGGASAFGLGARVSQTREAKRIVQEGEPQACADAQREGREEPRCSVPLRL
ncbi:MAG: hypothetical protein AAGA56_21420, partial [Myxococcota bacterium]